MRNPALTDAQVLTLIRAHPGSNLYQLTKLAKKVMPRWTWSVGKIQKSAQRLKMAEKICGRTKIKGGRACQQLYSRI